MSRFASRSLVVSSLFLSASRPSHTISLLPLFLPFPRTAAQIDVQYATEHRCGVRLRAPGLTDTVTDTDPLKDNLPLLRARPTLDTPAARRTADIINRVSDAFAEVRAARFGEVPEPHTCSQHCDCLLSLSLQSNASPSSLLAPRMSSRLSSRRALSHFPL